MSSGGVEGGIEATVGSPVRSSMSSMTEEANCFGREEGNQDQQIEGEPTAVSPSLSSGQNTEGAAAFVVNPTGDTLADGLVGLLRPSLETLDSSVAKTRAAQNELKARIEALESQLITIQSCQDSQPPVVRNLESYINKLTSSKKRILVVNSILQGAQDRLNKVHQHCLRETAKRRTLLEPATAAASSSSSTSAAPQSPNRQQHQQPDVQSLTASTSKLSTK